MLLRVCFNLDEVQRQSNIRPEFFNFISECKSDLTIGVKLRGNEQRFDSSVCPTGRPLGTEKPKKEQKLVVLQRGDVVFYTEHLIIKNVHNKEECTDLHLVKTTK